MPDKYIHKDKLAAVLNRQIEKAFSNTRFARCSKSKGKPRDIECEDMGVSQYKQYLKYRNKGISKKDAREFVLHGIKP